MFRVDFYATHLVQQNALRVELGSAQPARFVCPDGTRVSRAPIPHAELAQLVQEAAPPPAAERLRNMGNCRFDHASPHGLMRVDVVATGPDQWKLLISKAADAPAAPAPATPALDLPPVADGDLPSASSRSPYGFGAPPAAGPAAAPAAPAPAAPAPAAVQPAAPSHSHQAPQVQLQAGEPAINKYLRQMIALDASDLHMSSDCAPLVRLHGEIMPVDPAAGPLNDAELRKLFMPILPERLVQPFEESKDVDFAHTIEGLSRFRANYFVDRKGACAVFRQIPFEILSPEQLGLPQQVLDLCWLSKGLVVVTGPTGSGKSTTLATLIDFINRNRADHILTIEDPIEFVHPNKKCLINQREITTHTKGFKPALRAALREDPDIVLVGEMRDLETISIAIETAETGHLVFGTLHTTTAMSTVDRIIDQFPTDQQAQIRVMLSESLKGVIAQTLCKKVGGGRVAAYEVLIGNSAVANLIREGKTFQLRSVMQTGKKQGMQTLNAHLFELVKEGKVEAREAYIKAVDKHGLKEDFAKNGIVLEM